MAVKPVELREYLEDASNIYEAIIIASKRARQIHDEMKIELAQRLETIRQLTAGQEPEEDLDVVVTNPDQLKVSIEFEKRPKPTELALEELRQKKLKYYYKQEGELFSKPLSTDQS
ncbi:MAG: DNA-directed RNA polymerase subunit omega [Bacteroidetes bacterium]|nr:DNA-directed RNA polymerase subunit omega [Bacteroidota bacterium]